MLAGAAAGFLVLVAGQPAPSAGAQSPIETDPADGEELSAPPTEILLRFEEPVGDAQISMGCNGNPFTSIENPPSVSDDGLTVTAALLSPPPAGDCNVGWSTTLPTGEEGDDGSFAFELLASPVTTPGQTTEPAETTETTVPADERGQSSRTTRSATPRRSPTVRSGWARCSRRSVSPCCSARSC